MRCLRVHDVPMAESDLADQRRVGRQLPAAHEQAQGLGWQVRRVARRRQLQRGGPFENMA